MHSEESNLVNFNKNPFTCYVSSIITFVFTSHNTMTPILGYVDLGVHIKLLNPPGLGNKPVTTESTGRCASHCATAASRQKPAPW